MSLIDEIKNRIEKARVSMEESPLDSDDPTVRIFHVFAKENFDLFTNILAELASLQGWTLVKDNLPESGKKVMFVQELNGKPFRAIGTYNAKYTLEADTDTEDIEMDYHEEEDKYYYAAGWYEQQLNWDDYAYISVNEKVLKWMPLPNTEGE